MPGSTWPLPTTPLDGAVTTAWLAALTTLTVILLARPGGSARSVAAAGSGSRVRDGGGEFDDGDREFGDDAGGDQLGNRVDRVGAPRRGTERSATRRSGDESLIIDRADSAR